MQAHPEMPGQSSQGKTRTHGKIKRGDGQIHIYIYIFKNDSYIAHSFQIRYSRKNLFVLMMFESIKVQMNSKQVNLMTV